MTSDSEVDIGFGCYKQYAKSQIECTGRVGTPPILHQGSITVDTVMTEGDKAAISAVESIKDSKLGDKKACFTATTAIAIAPLETEEELRRWRPLNPNPNPPHMPMHPLHHHQQ